MIQPKRRGFLLGAGALLMAPAIVRASSLMPVTTLNKLRIWTGDINAENSGGSDHFVEGFTFKHYFGV